MRTFFPHLQTFRHRRRRTFARVAVPLVLAIGVGSSLSSCSSSGSDGAVLTVNNAKLSRNQLEADLAAFADAQVASKPDAEAKKTELARYHGTDRDQKTWNADYTAFMLDRRMVDRIIDQEFKAAKLAKPTILPATKQQLMESYGGATIYATLPASFRETAERSAAQYDAIVAADLKKLGDPKAYYEKHKDQFGGEVCASHILVAKKEDADAIKKGLANGDDFAAVAKAKSTDTGSGANGGFLGCASPSTYVPEFAKATQTLPLNTVSDPVQTQFGFHLIKVAKRTDASYASAKDKVIEAMKQEVGPESTKRLIQRLTDAKVTVDARYGTYVAKGSNGYPQIQSKANAKATADAATAATAVPPTTVGG
jgi:parvulin-like peptidyl-prolyl isomerase